jgi:NTP pyrophosphatase (non-canonical NTP hydrolase)
LAGLQDYVRKVVKLRGFEDETVEDGLLLFVEEIGELARAVRIFVGLKSSRRKRSNIYQHLREELADCLIYLIDIANLADIDLENAVRKKEMHDLARRWH